MFDRPDQIQSMLAKSGLQFHVACVTHRPTGKDELPGVLIARNPVYDSSGVMAEADFKPGSIEDYPVVIDHWVDNFQDEITHPDGSIERIAYGIGLPADRLINHKSVQTLGNRKDIMHTILSDHGVAIDTYGVGELDKLEADYGNCKVIFKPQGGSNCKGIEVYSSISRLQDALRRRDIPRNGLVQPFLDFTNPIPNLEALSPEGAKRLKVVNVSADRGREIRVHIFITTDPRGEKRVETFPILKSSAPGTAIMEHCEYTALDPECFPEDSFVSRKTRAIALAAVEKAQAYHLYGVADWSFTTLPQNQTDQAVIADFNCRGPRLWEGALPAREAFINMLTTIARQNST